MRGAEGGEEDRMDEESEEDDCWRREGEGEGGRRSLQR